MSAWLLAVAFTQTVAVEHGHTFRKGNVAPALGKSDGALPGFAQKGVDGGPLLRGAEDKLALVIDSDGVVITGASSSQVSVEQGHTLRKGNVSIAHDISGGDRPGLAQKEDEGPIMRGQAKDPAALADESGGDVIGIEKENPALVVDSDGGVMKGASSSQAAVEQGHTFRKGNVAIALDISGGDRPGLAQKGDVVDSDGDVITSASSSKGADEQSHTIRKGNVAIALDISGNVIGIDEENPALGVDSVTDVMLEVIDPANWKPFHRIRTHIEKLKESDLFGELIENLPELAEVVTKHLDSAIDLIDSEEVQRDIKEIKLAASEVQQCFLQSATLSDAYLEKLWDIARALDIVLKKHGEYEAFINAELDSAFAAAREQAMCFKRMSGEEQEEVIEKLKGNGVLLQEATPAEKFQDVVDLIADQEARSYTLQAMLEALQESARKAKVVVPQIDDAVTKVGDAVMSVGGGP